MNLRRILPYRAPSPVRGQSTSGGGGPAWRAFVTIVLVLGASYLLASIILQPTKRNVEALAGIIFICIALVADPFKALIFTVLVVPYPAYTSIGTTNTLLIFAVAGLVMVKSRQLRLESPFVKRDVDLAMMGWMIMVALSFYAQPKSEMGGAVYTALGLTSAVVLFYMVVQLCNTRARVWRLLWASQLGAATLALLGVMQYVFPDKKLLPEFFSFSRRVANMEEIRRGTVRVMGTFSGQELYAEYIACCIIFQFFLMQRARTINGKLFWGFVMLLSLAALFATATRGSLIVLILGFGYMTVFGNRAVPRATFLKLIFVAIAVFYLSLGFIEPLVSHMMDRVANIGSADESIQARSVVLTQAIDAVADSPIIGHGLAVPPGTFRGYVTMNIHNLYVTLAYTIGLVGLTAFVALLVGLFRAGWTTMRDPRVDADARRLGLALNTALVMFIVDEIKIEFTRQALYMHLVFLMFGMIVATWRTRFEDSSNETW